ncbi:MAG: adenylate/guanylate cyclase domain-containing protein [Candidatus Gastranaerophilaceae bacterium]
MKNNILKILLLLAIAIVSIICINLPCINSLDRDVASIVSFGLTVIFCVVTYFSLAKFSRAIAVSGAFLLFLIYLFFAFALIKESAAFTRSAIILTQTSLLIFAYISAVTAKTKTTKKIKQVVAKYVADKVLENIDEAQTVASGGTKELLTVMFIDIRGFTAISEKRTAETVTEILNNYFREIIPVITKNHGIVHKFIGDALLVVFNGKSPEEHAKNAVKAGKEILQKLKTFRIMQEALGKEKITAGIGINTGEVFVGYVGTKDRCEYTVIGDTVNLASRTESANRLYKTEFLITENTYNYVKEIADVIKISDVEMKGKKQKINVYEVLRVSEE